MAEHYPIACEEGKRICLEQKPMCLPRYSTCHTSIVATGKKGSAPGELHVPCNVTIHEDTHQIFIVNKSNHRVEIFSETGEFLYQLGVGQLYRPLGIATHRDSVFVSCIDHTISKYSLTEMCRVRRIGSEGLNNGQFNHPVRLTTDSTGRVFIADYYNSRICIHNPDLSHLRNIKHRSISRPSDVKVSHDRLYILCPDNNPCACIQVRNLDGDKLHSEVTCRVESDVLRPFFFRLDDFNNFVISDLSSNSIYVFTPEGNLLHTIRREGDKEGMFFLLRGVAITPNGRIVCVSLNMHYGLQIFF